MSKKIAVLGGGPMGLTAAYELLKEGYEVDLFEKEGELGGMSAHFDFSGLDIEMYYHFVCGPDSYTFNLMKELGVYDKLKWTDTKMGFFYNGGLYKWGGPFELLLFPRANIIEKVRYGLHIFFASRRKKWESLDSTTALNWIRSWEGEKGYKKFWDSLFELKFYDLKEFIAAPWLWSRLARVGKSRKNLLQERMGYIEGGSRVIIDALETQIINRGGSIFVNAPAETVHFEGSCVSGITVNGVFKPYDKVVSTMPIQYIREIAPDLPVSDAEKLNKLDNVGVVCVIMKLKQALTSNFWVNITDERMDIPGMIELSNLNTELTDNILYIPFYMHKSHPKYSEPSTNFIKKAKDYVRLVNPGMTADKIMDIRVFRYEYAQPVATVRFLSKLPPIASDERKGFYFSDTAYCYPEDRSINESVKVAYEMVRLIRNS